MQNKKHKVNIIKIKAINEKWCKNKEFTINNYGEKKSITCDFESNENQMKIISDFFETPDMLNITKIEWYNLFKTNIIDELPIFEMIMFEYDTPDDIHTYVCDFFDVRIFDPMIDFAKIWNDGFATEGGNNECYCVCNLNEKSYIIDNIYINNGNKIVNMVIDDMKDICGVWFAIKFNKQTQKFWNIWWLDIYWPLYKYHIVNIIM